MSKILLRQKLLRKRTKIFDRYSKENEITKKLKKIINNKGLIIGCYYATNFEVNLKTFLQFLLKENFQVCLPFINKLNSHLLFKEIKKNTKLLKGKYNIMVPDNENFLIPRILIIPLVGFDLKKNRIGYGGGYYDRTIEFYEKTDSIFKIGIAFDEQETKNLPIEKYDKKLDIIITPSRLVV